MKWMLALAALQIASPAYAEEDCCGQAIRIEQAQAEGRAVDPEERLAALECRVRGLERDSFKLFGKLNDLEGRARRDSETLLHHRLGQDTVGHGATRTP